ncbi:T9SS type A sorting domain-containing protein [Hymenobacter cellulosivorans]|uniref:T9SS type A sorting domain-containing protein n=1 Tax=Hymenobacter cellulosivorans TaxID=2932249 RepID=A0ABY4FC27_9BACT|nr:T9SS type A sorting domain-containing protein [Hymenobacter cellulosivorans]UOQ54094.1 T9SS type A sorting domain-containing protein [Hymenobacter cellulosivorans]
MKKTALGCLLGLSLLGSSTPTWAQAPVSCGAVNPTDMVGNFAAWDWETAPSDPNYCKIWAIRTTNQAQGVSHGAPWERATGKLQRIAYDRDYTRAKGWELLRMNLGAQSPVAVPYVILYNKYTGMIRTYFWLNNRTYQNGAVITMSHSSVNGTGSTGVLAMTNTQLVAADKYLATNNYTDEMISYVAKMTSQEGWIVGEFSATYDPHFANSRYSGNSLDFNIFGTVSSDITLGGSLSFKTDAQEGYALAGPKTQMVQNDPSDPTRLKKFLATGKRVLGSVSADDADKFLNKVHEGGLKLAASSNSKASNTGLSIANATRPANQGGGLRKTVGTVLGAASVVSSAFGIIGQIVGAIWPADEATAPSEPAFTPTISEGSISMSGSITTTYPLMGVSIQVPGTPHNANDRSTQPYYNNPLGVFTIKNTPVLNKMQYTYYAGYDTSYDPCGANGQDGNCMSTGHYRDRREAMDSYQVQNDLVGAFNKPAGLELVSAQAALVGELAGPLFEHSYEYHEDNGAGVTQDGVYHNYMDWQFNSDILEITRLDVPGQPNMFQTKFVDISCFKNMAFTVKRGTKVFVRVKAELKRQGTTDDSPVIYFVQDYAVQVNTSGVTATNPRYPNAAYPADPPFSNLLAGQPEYWQSLNDPTYTWPGTYQAMGDLTASGLVDHANTTTPTYYMGYSVSLLPGFGVTPGTNFVAGGVFQNNCGNSLVEVNVQNSLYNLNAYRPMVLAATETNPVRSEGFVVYPNPTRGKITVETNVLAASGPITLTLYDLYGRTLREIKDIPAGSTAYQLDLQGQPVGVYLLKMRTPTKSVSQKVVVE